MTPGERIKALRKARGLTVDQLAAKLGKNRATIYRYESNEIENMPLSVLRPLSMVLRTTPEYIMGWSEEPEGKKYDFFLPREENSSPSETTSLFRSPLYLAASRPAGGTVPFRVLSSVRAGVSGPAQETFSDTVEEVAYSNLRGYLPEDCRVLAVQGDSMEPRFMDGDKILIHLQPTVENGAVAVCLSKGGFSLRRIYSSDSQVTLVPTNPRYETQLIAGDGLSSFHIYGKVIRLMCNF